MVVFSYYLSRKYYPIPYNWKLIAIYFFGGIVLYLVSKAFAPPWLWLKYMINTLYIALFVLFVLRLEHVRLTQVKQVVTQLVKKNKN
jgi:hypothetical protein